MRVSLEGRCDFTKKAYFFSFLRRLFGFLEQRGVFCFFTRLLFALRTQEELRMREEDQQTITVEVELKRHDSEPSISAPQPTDETRYQKNDTRMRKKINRKHAGLSEIQQNTSYPSLKKKKLKLNNFKYQI